MKSRSKQKGIVLVEVVVVVSILLIIITGLIFANIAYIKSASYTLKSTKATFLAQEGVEAVKYLRSFGWDTLPSVGVIQYLTFDTTAGWTATTSEEKIGDFYRYFILENVNRDGNDDIASSGTLDPNTKKLTINVSWPGATGTTTREIQTYITNFLE